MSQINKAITRAQLQAHAESMRGENLMQQQDRDLSSMQTASHQKTNKQQSIDASGTAESLKKQGIRIDLPGSPAMGIDESSDGTMSTEQMKDTNSVPSKRSIQENFRAASKNTMAVAEALEKILQRNRAARDRAIQQQKEAEALNKSPEKTIESEFANVPELKPLADKSQVVCSTEKQFKPRWNVPSFSWPVTVDQLLERGLEGYEEVSQYILQQSEMGKKVISIHSYSAGEGCSTLAMCLSRLFAKQKVKTALVDTTFHHAELALQLGIEVEQGWESVCDDYGYGVNDVTVYSENEQLTLLPLATSAVADHHLLGLKQSINQMRSAHELILLDAGKVEPQTKQLGFVDGAIIVKDVRSATNEHVTEVVQQLTAAGIPILGVTENFVE